MLPPLVEQRVAETIDVKIMVMASSEKEAVLSCLDGRQCRPLPLSQRLYLPLSCIMPIEDQHEEDSESYAFFCRLKEIKAVYLSIGLARHGGNASLEHTYILESLFDQKPGRHQALLAAKVKHDDFAVIGDLMVLFGQF